MTPYGYYVKQSQNPGFTSATDTGGMGKPFKAPGYYNQPGMDPQLAAQGRALEAEYGRQFPYGDYTFSGKGWTGSRNLTQEQIDLRNRFKLYEAKARGNSQIPTHAINPSPSAASAFVGDLARSRAWLPAAPALYLGGLGYDVATKGLDQTRADRAKQDAVYRDMLLDSGKRVANRWGGNFELQYNDPLLDYSSYALEAAPSLLLAAATGGGSTSIQGAVNSARVPTAARTLIQGFQPVAQSANNPFVRSLGKHAPGALNYAAAGLNPVPLMYSAATSSPGASSVLLSQLGAHLGTRTAANNYLDAARDTQAFNQNNPEANIPASAMRFAESLGANGISLDPTSNPYGLGLSLVMPGYAQQGYDAIEQALASHVASLPPEAQALARENPAYLNELRTQVTNEFVSSNPSFPYVSGLAEVSSFNPLRALGARTYSEDLNQDAIAAGTAWAPFAEAFATGKDPMQDPKVQEALATASPEAKQKMQQSLTFRMGQLAPEMTGALLNLQGMDVRNPRLYDELSALQQDPTLMGSSRLGQHLMQSPVAGLVGNDPENVLGATVRLANLSSMLSSMHDVYQQTGQAPSGYAELLEGARRLNVAQQDPSSAQASFTEALAGLDPVMIAAYESMQPPEESSR